MPALAIARRTNGTYTATLDSLDQGAREIPATAVTFSDSILVMEWEALNATYQGQLENGRLIGFWNRQIELRDADCRNLQIETLSIGR